MLGLEMSSDSPIRVAIIGGGLAGVAMLRGLLQHRHIAADLYESRPTFREEGPGIFLGPSSQAVLYAIDPTLEGCLERAGAVSGSMEIRIAAGPEAGKQVYIDSFLLKDKKTVGRQELLSELLANIPPGMVHFNTRLSFIKNVPDGGVLLGFCDGTKRKYDLAIGADGINGAVRQHILGPDDPARKPKPSGYWGLPIQVPLERAQHFLGKDWIDPGNPRLVGWLGDGTWMHHDLTNNGKDVQIVIYAEINDISEEYSWAKIITPEEFSALFSNSIPPACRGTVQLIPSVYTVQIPGICQMQQVPASTYVTHNACIIGEAASSILPMQNTATTLSLEEALIMSTLMGRTFSTADIPAALQAFDQVCRPRSKRCQDDSFDLAQILTGRRHGVGLDPVLLAESLMDKWKFIQTYDIDAHKNAALEAMDRESSSWTWH